MKWTNALCLLIIIASPLKADDFLEDKPSRDHSGWFVGGKLGNLNTTFETYSYDGFDYEAVESEKSASVVSVYFGYNFTDWFGLEAEMSITGDADEDLINNELGYDAVDSSALVGLRLQPKFTWQIANRIGLFAKVGLYSAAYAATIESNPYSATNNYYSETHSWSGTGFTTGVGVQYTAVAGLTLRLVYDYSFAELDTKDDGVFDEKPIDATVSEFGLGVHYQF